MATSSTPIKFIRSHQKYWNTDFLSEEVKTYYIYATTNRSTPKRDDVYLLDLLKLCPDSSSSYVIDNDDSDDSDSDS